METSRDPLAGRRKHSFQDYSRGGGATTRTIAVAHLTYFIVSEPFVKIGISHNPERRLDELRIGCPHPIRIAAVVCGGSEVEKALHAQFADLRHQGDWFHLRGKLASLVLELEASTTLLNAEASHG